MTFNLLASSPFALSFLSFLTILFSLSSSVSPSLGALARLPLDSPLPLSSTLAITSFNSRTLWVYAAIAAGTLFAESRRTADWARWRAMVRTDLDELEGEVGAVEVRLGRRRVEVEATGGGEARMDESLGRERCRRELGDTASRDHAMSAPLFTPRLLANAKHHEDRLDTHAHQ
jgi:hypothetical protein